MSDCPRAKASNRPTLAFQPTIAMKMKNSVSKMPAASANASAIAGSAASRSPSSSAARASGLSSAAFMAMTVKMTVTSIVMPKNRTIASKATHLRQPCHLRISSGSSVSNIDPLSGIVSSSSACSRPRTRGMCTPMPAPLSRSHSVYHICCMPDGPAKASAPTTIGKNAAVNASSGMPVSKRTVPTRVSPRSAKLPTKAPTMAEPITSTPTRKASSPSMRL